MRVALPTVALVLGLTSNARADVVFPPTDACPPGAIASTSHAGPHCAPSLCTTPSDCRASSRSPPIAFECAEAGLCVGTRHVFGGRGGRVDLALAYGSCRVGADCPTGVPCEIATRCIAPGSVAGPVAESALPREVARTAAGAGTCGATGVIGGDDALARALAPLAHRVRAEVDDDGETTYALDEDEPSLTRAAEASSLDDA